MKKCYNYNLKNKKVFSKGRGLPLSKNQGIGRGGEKEGRVGPRGDEGGSYNWDVK